MGCRRNIIIVTVFLLSLSCACTSSTEDPPSSGTTDPISTAEDPSDKTAIRKRGGLLALLHANKDVLYPLLYILSNTFFADFTPTKLTNFIYQLIEEIEKTRLEIHLTFSAGSKDESRIHEIYELLHSDFIILSKATIRKLNSIPRTVKEGKRRLLKVMGDKEKVDTAKSLTEDASLMCRNQMLQFFQIFQYLMTNFDNTNSQDLVMFYSRFLNGITDCATFLVKLRNLKEDTRNMMEEALRARETIEESLKEIKEIHTELAQPTESNTTVYMDGSMRFYLFYCITFLFMTFILFSLGTIEY